MACATPLPVRFALLLAALAGGAGARTPPTLAELQGVWWSDCGQPAAEFGIDGDAFHGDFAGRFRARVERGTLRVDALDGRTPARAWRIVEATRTRLVLRPLQPGAPQAADWVLRSCPEPELVR